MQLKVTKLRIHIRDIIPDRSAVLDFLLDGTTFRVRSTFRTCLSELGPNSVSSGLLKWKLSQSS